jgi:hypothetical protein
MHLNIQGHATLHYMEYVICITVDKKFYVKRFSIGRKRLSMVLLDEKVILTRIFVFTCSK